MESIKKKPFRFVATEIDFSHEKRDKIFETFFVVSDYLKEYPNPGACHLLSSYLYILLQEQKIDCDICVGEVKTGNFFFDHSWVEIDGKIFDVAIQLTYDETKNPPVFANFDLGTEKITDRKYGVSSPTGLDIVAQTVLSMSLAKYLTNADFTDGQWKTIKKLGKTLRLKLDVIEIKEKYKDTQRKFVGGKENE